MTNDATHSDASVLLNDVNADVGTYSLVTVNAKGLVTAARDLRPDDLAAEFPSKVEGSGYTTLPGGLLFQWGTTSFTGLPSTTIGVDKDGRPAFTSFGGVAAPVVFPVPFQQAVFSCTGTGANDGDFEEGCEVSVGIKSLSNTGALFSVGRVIGSNTATDKPDRETGDIMWMAIGK